MAENQVFLVDVEFRELVRLERQYFGKRKGFYKYLAAVLNFCGYLDRQGELAPMCFALANMHGWKGKSKDPLRIIVDLTSSADDKTRSRLGRALRFAFDQSNDWQPSNTLDKFLRKHGGIAGCAKRIAEPREKGYVPGRYLIDWR